MRHPISASIAVLVSLLTIAPVSAQDRMTVYCEPGTEASKEVAVYSAPGGYVAIEKLRCGQEVTLVTSNQGFSRIITPNNKVGFVVASQLRKVQTAEDLKPRIERLEQEVQQLKAARGGSESERLSRLEEEVRELKARPSSAAPRAELDTPGTPIEVRPPSTKASQESQTVSVPSSPASPVPQVSLRDFPRAELFGGYSYARTEGGANLHGWNASVAGNVNRWFGIAGDVSGHYISEEPASADFYTVLVGPRFSVRGERATAFAHAMVGVTRFSAGADIFGVDIGISDTALAMAFGGGIDIHVSKHIAIRAIQAEYLPVRSEGVTVNNVRVEAGVVLKF